MKNKAKCNEKLTARLKAMVDENARITIQETVEAVDISSGSVLTFRRQTPPQQGLS